MSRNAFFTSALYLLCRELEDDESLWSRGAKVCLFKWWEVISPKMYNPHLWQSISITHQNEYVKPKWKRGYCEVLVMVKWFFFNLLSVKKCAGVFMWEIFCFPILFFDFFQLAAWSFSLPKTSCLGLCYWPQNARLIFLSLEKYFATPKCISLKYQ